MKAIVSYFSLIIVLTIFSGCSQKSTIEKVSESKSHFEDAVYEGQDFYTSNQKIDGEKYRIFHQASTGFSGTSGIRKNAESRATQFCLDKKKKMIKLSEHTAKPPYILGNFPRIEIIFTCVDDIEIQENNKEHKYDQLVKIKKLLDDGILTQDEFESEKIKILGNQ